MAQNEKLRLSIAGGTGWAAGDVLHCPHKHYLKYELGWRIKLMPKPLAFGILFHEAYFTNEMDKMRETWERGIIQADEEAKNGRDWPIDRDEDKVEADMDQAEAMADELNDQDLQLRDFEVKMSSPIIDPETGKTPSHLEGVEVSGCRDCLEDLHGPEDIADLKTSASRWPKGRANASIQIPTYRYLEACTGAEKIHDRGHYLVITKTKQPKFQRNTVDMGDNDFFSVYTRFKAAAEAILRYRKEAEKIKKSAKAWPKTGPCLGTFLQTCPYHPICFPERYSEPEEVVNSALEARF